tara:strand:- start:956 stop:1243 length:288 start_codon:yes stop_codon:yes gene_type:complete
MEITKDKLLQIIKEEIQKVTEQEGLGGDLEAEPSNSQEMAEKFKKLSQIFPQLVDIEDRERDLLNTIIFGSIDLAAKGAQYNNLAVVKAELEKYL